MPEGNVAITVNDGALGILPSNTANLVVHAGVCSSGTAGTLYSYSSIADLTAGLGTGPAVEAAAFQLALAGGSVLVCPINASVVGVAGAVTMTRVASSTSVMSLTGTPLDAY